MLPDPILPTPEDDIGRILRDYERRLSHLETLEGVRIGARVFNSAGIVVASGGAGTILTFDSERFDTDAIHNPALNPSRLTANTAGLYVIGGSFRWESVAGGRRLAEIIINGGNEIVRHEIGSAADATGFPAHTPVSLWDMAVGDFAELRAAQSSGANRTIPVDADQSIEFWMIRAG